MTVINSRGVVNRGVVNQSWRRGSWRREAVGHRGVVNRGPCAVIGVREASLLIVKGEHVRQHIRLEENKAFLLNSSPRES